MHVYIVINRVKKRCALAAPKHRVFSLCSTELACVRPVIAGGVGSSVFIQQVISCPSCGGRALSLGQRSSDKTFK